jgi:hypothetical protein
VTIGTLPDDVLLNILKLFVDAIDCDNTASDEWHILIHVCRRWRNLAFASPRYLNLQLLYIPHLRSVEEMLDTWGEIPIYIQYCAFQAKEARANVVAALRLNHRVSGFWLQLSSYPEWEALDPLNQLPFPTLTRLWIGPSYPSNKFKAIPRSFLSGSAPSLRDLSLNHIPFPTLPELLLSSTNLVRLWYGHIPQSGYISPQDMVTGLSALTRLETLCLIFQSSQSLPDSAIRIPPSHTGSLLPALSYLCFQGVPEYLEYLVAQIHDPFLEGMDITFFHQEVLEISELAKFIRRADKLSSLHRGEVSFESERVSVKLSQHSWGVDDKTLFLNPACPESVFRLSYLAQFCASCFPTPSPFESIYIRVPFEFVWKDVIEDPDAQLGWLELLRPFNVMKHLHLSHIVAPRVAQALRRLPSDRVTEVLPALEIVFISGLELGGPVKEAMSEFAVARQLSGHPVSICDWEGGERLTL